MLPLIPQDKANHLAYGAAISCAAYVGARLLDLPHALPIAVGCVLALAVAKEVRDHLNNRALDAAGLAPRHGVEVADIAWTVAGAAPLAAGAML